MDITSIPASSLLSNHSHHIYHPRPLPHHTVRGGTFPSSSMSSDMHVQRQAASFSGYSYRTRRQPWECLPPVDGSSPIARLPDELWFAILGHLSLEELLAVRLVDRRLADLALAPSLHKDLMLSSLPPYPLPPLLTHRLLPHARSLEVHLFPFPLTRSRKSTPPSVVLMALLSFIPANQLRSLSLPFSAPNMSTEQFGSEFKRVGGRLERLDLRGSGLCGHTWVDWIDTVGRSGPGLQDLNLGFTSIAALPRADDPHGPFRSLINLSLSSCSSLPASGLAGFLADLPPMLQTLDLSRLDQVTLDALIHMRVVKDGTPTALREIRLVGIDHLTKQNIRMLKRHWEDRRKACVPADEADIDMAAFLPVTRVWGEPTDTTHLSARDLNDRPTPRSLFQTPQYRQTGRRWSSSILHGAGADADSPVSTPGSAVPITPWTPIGQNRAEPTIVPPGADPLPWSPSDAIGADRLPSHPYLPSPAYDAGPTRKAKYSNGHGLLGAPIELEAPRPRQMERSRPEGSSAKPDRISVNIVHSAILESEDIAGYRQFIGTVAGGTVVGPLGPAVVPDPTGGFGAPGVLGGGAGLGHMTGLGGFGGGLGLGLGFEADEAAPPLTWGDEMMVVDGGGLM